MDGRFLVPKPHRPLVACCSGTGVFVVWVRTSGAFSFGYGEMVRRRLEACDLLLLRLIDANDSCECDAVSDGTGSAAEPASVKMVDATED